MTGAQLFANNIIESSKIANCRERSKTNQKPKPTNGDDGVTSTPKTYQRFLFENHFTQKQLKISVTVIF